MANGGFDLSALKNQGMGLVRGGVWFAAGVTVGRGWLGGDSAVTIAGAILALLGGGLTGAANTNSSITQAFSQIPEVKGVAVTDPKLAEAAKKADPATEVKLVKES
jgi:hypothetical protein